MQLISLTVKERRGVVVNQVQLVDIDDIGTPIIEANGGADSSFFLRESRQGPYPASPTNTALTQYVVDQTIANIVGLSFSFFSANVLTVKGRSNPALMAFNVAFVAGTIIPWQGGSKFFYQEDADPDLVEYTVSQTPAQILAQITPPAPTPTSVPVGQAVFVSASSGNDGTGLREQFEFMFATVEAAQAAALAGDTIFVYPGTYTNSISALGADGINWEIMNGAEIVADGFGFDDGGGNMTYKISGEGKITGTVPAITMSGAGSNVEVSGVKIESASTTGAIQLTDGSLTLKNVKVENTDGAATSYGIVKDGGTLILDDVVIVCAGATESIHASGAQNVKIYSAVANVDVTPLLITNIISGTVLYVDTDVE